MHALVSPDKENVQPAQCVKESPAQLEGLQKKLAEARRTAAEDQAKAKAAAQAHAEMEKAAEKVAQEKRANEIRARQEAEKQAQQKAQAAAEVAIAAAEQLRIEQAQEAAEEEDKRQQQEAKRLAELAAATESVIAWCKKNGYSDMNTPKKTMRGATKFPLHTAVKHQNVEMVGLLLKCGVDQQVQDSRKQSPLQLAAANNKKGSHHVAQDILALLC